MSSRAPVGIFLASLTSSRRWTITSLMYEGIEVMSTYTKVVRDSSRFGEGRFDCTFFFQGKSRSSGRFEPVSYMPGIELLLKSERPRRAEVFTGTGGSIVDPRQACPLAKHSRGMVRFVPSAANAIEL
jgi:hypothetical protein